MDIESDPLYQEEANLDFAFVYIPYSADRLIGGHVRGTDGAVLQGKGTYTMKRVSTGEYELQIPQRRGGWNAVAPGHWKASYQRPRK